MTKVNMKPIVHVNAAGLYPYDFLAVYCDLFPQIGQRVAFVIPASAAEFQQQLEEVKAAWADEDAETPASVSCRIQVDGLVFTHETVSGRTICYDAGDLTLSADFRGGSSTFAYGVLATLAPLLETEKWRGIGGGNVAFNGSVANPFSLSVSF